MQAIGDWLGINGAPVAPAGLYTGGSLLPFYEKFGFAPSFGMARKRPPETKRNE